MKHRIYVASSWKNKHHDALVEELRVRGHSVYDYRNPGIFKPFMWSQVDTEWEKMSSKGHIETLTNSPLCQHGFIKDFMAMKWADTCILIEPSGRSSHLEAGYFAGANKTLLVYLAEPIAPELMLKMANKIVSEKQELFNLL